MQVVGVTRERRQDATELTSTTTEPDEKAVQYYRISMCDSASAWDVSYRYSSIAKLKNKLKRQRRSDVPAFPPKMLRVLSKPTEEKLERRCQGIQTFLQSLLAIPRWQEHPEVRAFLDPDRKRRLLDAAERAQERAAAWAVQSSRQR